MPEPIPLKENRFIYTLASPLVTCDRRTIFQVAKFDVYEYSEDLFEEFDIPMPDEIQKSVPKRQAEFLAGRILVKQALSTFQIEPKSPAIGPMREPVWPKRITGSISHSEGFAAACVSRRPGKLVGLDIERIIEPRTISSIENFVVNEVESRLLQRASVRGLHRSFLYTLVFSAKESFYKMVFPSIQRVLEFDVIELQRINPENRMMVFKVADPECQSILKRRIIQIRWEWVGKMHLITLATCCKFA